MHCDRTSIIRMVLLLFRLYLLPNELELNIVRQKYEWKDSHRFYFLTPVAIKANKHCGEDDWRQRLLPKQKYQIGLS